MKQVLRFVIVAVVAAVVALAAVRIDDAFDEPDDDLEANASGAVGSASAGAAFSVTAELVEDAWVNGARTAGLDHKPLADAENSICYLTKVEIMGARGPDDSNSCRIEIDDFTGYWEVVAEIAEGGQSEVRCNARCLVWE